VEGVRLRPASVPEDRATDGVEIAPRCASGLAEVVVLWTDCVRVCDLVDGALVSWLTAGTLVERPLDSFDTGGGGIAILSA